MCKYCFNHDSTKREDGTIYFHCAATGEWIEINDQPRGTYDCEDMDIEE